MLAVSRGRWTTQLSTSRLRVLPQRFSGERTQSIGDTPEASETYVFRKNRSSRRAITSRSRFVIPLGTSACRITFAESAAQLAALLSQIGGISQCRSEREVQE